MFREKKVGQQTMWGPENRKLGTFTISRVELHAYGRPRLMAGTLCVVRTSARHQGPIKVLHVESVIGVYYKTKQYINKWRLEQ